MIFLDVETTGLSITKDRIIQIACIKGKQEKVILLNPMIPISPSATEVHGITDEMVKSCPTFPQVANSLLDYLGIDEDLAGYNSNRFDLPILIEEFGRVGIHFSLEGRKIIDVFQIECRRNSRSLAAVYERVTGKELSEAHDALIDTRATMVIFEDQKKKMEEEDLMLQDPDMIDVAGKLKMIDGVPCWNFGKWQGQPLRTDLGYCSWVLKNDFSKQVKDAVRSCL